MKIPQTLTFSNLFLIFSLTIGLALLFFPNLLLTPGASKGAGLAIIAISLFATARIAEYLTTLLFFFLAMTFHVAPANVVFAGFHSTGIWLVFGGLVIGLAIAETGLGKRIANQLAGHLEGSYTKLIAGMVSAGVLLAFIMPSAAGRIMLMLPITLALADHFNFKPGSNGRIGLILASTLGGFLPAFSILSANVPNIILAGMAESQMHITLLFGEYLLVHFPALGLVKALVLIALIVWLYPDQPVVNPDNAVEYPQSMSGQEKILAVTLFIMLLLWLTDFLHHTSPAWIALGGAVFLMLPWMQVVSNDSFSHKLNYGTLFFVAGLVGLGGVIQDSGLGKYIGEGLMHILPLDPATPFISYMSVALASSITGILTTLPGIPPVVTPLTPDLVTSTGLSPKAILMMQVLGFSTIFLPYQAPVLILALQLARENAKTLIKPLILTSLLFYIVVFPLNYWWWRWLGMI